MNIGIVSYWFNRGQATVSRYIRNIFDDLGHDTFILARPTKVKFVRSNFISTKDVWHQNKVTSASSFDIPFNEYRSWAIKNNIEIVFFDQNYQFEEIKKLKQMGLITIGRFVWESFKDIHVEKAKSSFDVIYSITKCEQKRYGRFNIESPYLRWGIHPELLEYNNTQKQSKITFFYPGGYLSPRKSTGAVIEAFSRVDSGDIRLIIKCQKELRSGNLVVPTNRTQTQAKNISDNDPVLLKRFELMNDKRIKVIADDNIADDYYKLFSSCQVCLSPSRWEGLGLHLYESLGFGLPIVTNNIPPMNEVVINKKNGLLVESFPIGPARSGVMAFEPEIKDLERAIKYLSNESNLEHLSTETINTKNRYHWNYTIEDFNSLISYV